MIDAATVAQILRLSHAERWPVGTIATQLGLHHDTVERVLEEAGRRRGGHVPAGSIASSPSSKRLGPSTRGCVQAASTTCASRAAMSRRVSR